MRIGSAAAATGLTRKAIKHYESEGLVTPRTDPQSGYREYGDDDIARLELIHTLRLLDVPISDIREVVRGDTPFTAALQRALERTTGEIERLEEGRSILRSLLERSPTTAADVSDEVRRLRHSVERSREERRLHLADELTRIFPGSFGRFMVLLHAPFFDVELETEAQKRRWRRFVDYLDDLREPPSDHPFFQLAHVEDEATVAAFLEGQHEHVRALLDEDTDAIAALREATAGFLRSLASDADARQRHAERLAASKDLWEAIAGGVDDAFNEHLAALNDDYRRYLEIGARIRDEAEREVGFRLDQASTERA